MDCRFQCLLILGAAVLLCGTTAFAFSSQDVVITIKKGDSLSDVCRNFLEDPRQWREVARINRLQDPNRIYPGEKLIIPIELLKGLPMDGRVTFVKGDVAIQLENTKEWKTVHMNERISEGSRIRTGKESALEVTYEKGVVFLMRADTLLKITKTREKNALNRLYRLLLNAGKTVSNIRRITGNESRFKIDTPSAVAAVRGTDFRMSVDPNAVTRCEVLKGEVTVSGARREVRVGEGEGTVVEKFRAPLEPKKLLPAPSPRRLLPLYRSMPLEFAFESVPGAVLYRLILARDKAFKDLLKDQTFDPSATVKIIGLDDGAYYLQSRAIDEVGLEGISSQPFEIRVRVNPLPPFIQTPVDGAEYREKRIDFRWLSVGDAAAYQMQIAEDEAFNILVEDRHLAAKTVYKAKGFDYKTYYFRTRSIAEDGYEGIWSDTLSFAIIPPPPSPPLEAPDMAEKEVVIRWRNLGEGFAYHFQMAADAAFHDLILDRKLDKPEIRIPKPEKTGTYYLRTSAIDSEGYEGEFSAAQRFEIKAKFPYIPAALFVVGFLSFFLF
jgi:hypothetical protein